MICSDKTGTLTRDEMTVREIRVDGHRFDVTGSGYEPTGTIESPGDEDPDRTTLERLLSGGALASDARLEQVGDLHPGQVQPKSYRRMSPARRQISRP